MQEMAAAEGGMDVAHERRLKKLKETRTRKKRYITMRINQLERMVGEKGGRRAIGLLLGNLETVYHELEGVCGDISDICDDEDPYNDIEEIRFQVETSMAMVTEYLEARKDDPTSDNSSIALSWVLKHLQHFGKSGEDSASRSSGDSVTSGPEVKVDEAPPSVAESQERYTYSISRPATPASRVLPSLPLERIVDSGLDDFPPLPLERIVDSGLGDFSVPPNPVLAIDQTDPSGVEPTKGGDTEDGAGLNMEGGVAVSEDHDMQVDSTGGVSEDRMRSNSVTLRRKEIAAADTLQDDPSSVKQVVTSPGRISRNVDEREESVQFEWDPVIPTVTKDQGLKDLQRKIVKTAAEALESGDLRNYGQLWSGDSDGKTVNFSPQAGGVTFPLSTSFTGDQDVKLRNVVDHGMSTRSSDDMEEFRRKVEDAGGGKPLYIPQSDPRNSTFSIPRQEELAGTGGRRSDFARNQDRDDQEALEYLGRTGSRPAVKHDVNVNLKQVVEKVSSDPDSRKYDASVHGGAKLAPGNNHAGFAPPRSGERFYFCFRWWR